MTPLQNCCAGLIFALGFGFSVCAQELPTKSGTEDLEAEAKKLMDELPILDSEAPVDLQPEVLSLDEDPSSSVERFKKSLERARQKQQRWEKLAKRGVLSRAEAESCMVEVADALAKYERARVQLLQQQLSSTQDRVSKGEADVTMVEAVKSALQSSSELAVTAEQQAHSTRLVVARNNLDRHRKLHAAGLISRMQLQRAESNLRKIEASGQAAQQTSGAEGASIVSEVSAKQ